MLKPVRLSKEENAKVLNIISDLAKKPIDVINNDKMIQDFLRKTKIYHYDLPELENAKVVLSNQVYKKLIDLAKLSNLNEKNLFEFGCFLMGQYNNSNICFDDYSKSQPNYLVREFGFTKEMLREINNKINTSSVDCICLVHTHPYGETIYSSTPSNKDLYVEAFFQEQMNKIYDYDKNVNFLIALITPSTNIVTSFNDLCFMYYDKMSRKFYKITNISYINDLGEKVKLKREKYLQIRNWIVESIEERPMLLKR